MVGVACLALAVTGCTDNSRAAEAGHAPRASTAPKPTSSPALTPAQAHEALARYSKTNNLARLSQDRALLDSVEGGPRYAMSLADIKEDEALPEAAVSRTDRGRTTSRPPTCTSRG
ncbi:hypothetical protein ACFWZK_06410 [[Kitasatospora] papulosa]|uniref:hypothetical protein n=1 Tax=[Kitasatospora] papulosa TaxID=1464011 RepID=UPI0036C6AE91